MWFNNLPINQYRSGIMNNSIIINKNTLNYLADNFDSVFDTLVDVSDSISTVKFYPLNVLPKGKFGEVVTPKGTLAPGIEPGLPGYELTDNNGYYYLGEHKYYSMFDSEHGMTFAKYNNYTAIKVFLPFVGYVDIDMTDIASNVDGNNNMWLQFRLIVDFFTGSGLYVIGVSDDYIGATESGSPWADIARDSQYMRVVATYETQIGVDMPLGSSNAGDVKRNLIMGGVKVISGLATAAYTNSLPPAISTSTTVRNRDISARGKYKGARMKPVLNEVETTTTTDTVNKPVNKLRPIDDAISQSMNALNGSAPRGFSDRVSDSTLMSQLSTDIHVIIYEPIFTNQGDDYASLYGYPCNKIITLKNAKGYCEISAIHFEGDGFGGMTQLEKTMLEDIFSEGVIFPKYPIEPLNTTIETSETQITIDDM